jgi:hypothetical protein
MKNQLKLLLGMILFYSCSTTSDGKTETTAEVIGAQTWTTKNLDVTT